MKKQTKQPEKKLPAKKVTAKKEITKKVPAKKTAKETKDRDSNGRFKKGNEVAVKWTDATILPELEKILDVLTTDDSGDHFNNVVRANDIKYAEEAVMCAGVSLYAWEYWNSAKIRNEIKEDSTVFLLIKKIKKICELRLSYSGQVMDIFHLKNHYDYKDKTETDVTTKGQRLGGDIDYSKLPDHVLDLLISAKVE